MCNIESIVAVAREHIRPYLAYLLGLIDLLERIGLYVPLGSVSSMLLFGLTRTTDLYTLHSEVEITGC